MRRLRRIGRGLGMGEMEPMTDYLIPILLVGLCTFSLAKQENYYDWLLTGAGNGLGLLKTILPSLILLLTAVSMFRASGASQVLSQLLSPLFTFLGIPPECAMLVLIRPISGSAALAVGSDIIAHYGVDSQIGRTAAVMLGSTETTFYTLSVYFGVAGIRKSRYTLPVSLLADCIGFIVASLSVKLFFP